MNLGNVRLERVSLSVCLSVCFSLSCFCFTVYLCLYLCLFVYFPIHLSLYLYMFVVVVFHLSLFLFSVSPSLHLYWLSASCFLLCLSVCFPFSCPSFNVYLYLYLYLFVYLPPPPIFLSLCLSLNVCCLLFYLSPLLFVYLFLLFIFFYCLLAVFFACLSVSVHHSISSSLSLLSVFTFIRFLSYSSTYFFLINIPSVCISPSLSPLFLSVSLSFALFFILLTLVILLPPFFFFVSLYLKISLPSPSNNTTWLFPITIALTPSTIHGTTHTITPSHHHRRMRAVMDLLAWLDTVPCSSRTCNIKGKVSLPRPL